MATSAGATPAAGDGVVFVKRATPSGTPGTSTGSGGGGGGSGGGVINVAALGSSAGGAADRIDLMKEAQKKARDPRPTLREPALLTEDGFFALYRAGVDKAAARRAAVAAGEALPSEAQDAAALMQVYSLWARALFPRMHHADVLARLAGWSGRNVIKVRVLVCCGGVVRGWLLLW